MQKIQNRLNVGHYVNLEEMLADFVLMFDNACKYNEPDSQIYKVRHNLCLLLLNLVEPRYPNFRAFLCCC